MRCLVIDSLNHLSIVLFASFSGAGATLPDTCFVTCSSDHTVRFWNVDGDAGFEAKTAPSPKHTYVSEHLELES